MLGCFFWLKVFCGSEAGRVYIELYYLTAGTFPFRAMLEARMLLLVKLLLLLLKKISLNLPGFDPLQSGWPLERSLSVKMKIWAEIPP